VSKLSTSSTKLASIIVIKLCTIVVKLPTDFAMTLELLRFDKDNKLLVQTYAKLYFHAIFIVVAHELSCFCKSKFPL
jgi:hypothetical protein